MSITTGYSFILADTDTNWRLGRNIISETGNQLTSNTMQFIAANASGQGWQFVDDDGGTRFEIEASTGNAWLPSGNLYLNGNLAATQSWVTSQGYLTSVSDIWVNTAGDTMTGTLSFAQPVGLGFANGQYIKDNGNGGLIIYSGAAVGITGTSIAVSNNTTVAGWLGVTGIVSANARKLSLGILDLNSGVTPAQFKIKTTIPWNYGGSDFTVNIKGFRYGTGQMVSLSIGWHYYNNEFYNRNAISNGAWAPTISLAKSPDGYVIIHIPGPDYWPKLYVESVYSSGSTDSYTSGWSWSDADLSDWNIKFLQEIKQTEYIIYYNTCKNKIGTDAIIYKSPQNMIDIMKQQIKDKKYFIGCFDSLRQMNKIIDYLSNFGKKMNG